jgi:hypothetical protein
MMIVPALVTASLGALTMLSVIWQVGLGMLVLAALVLCVEVGVKLRRLRGTGLRLPARRIWAAVLRQHGSSLYHLGANIIRYYSLPLLAASLLWLPLLPPVLLLLVVPPLVDYRRLRLKTNPMSFMLLYWSEMVAYQTGVWRGCLKWHTLRPLIPRLRVSISRWRS